MEILQESIKVIITASGATFVGQEVKEQDLEAEVDAVQLGNSETGFITGLKLGSFNKIKLQYPFRFLIDQAAGITSVAAPVFREDWIVIDMNGAIECHLNPTIEELYRKYCNQIFSTIILPEDKKIILGA